MIILNKITTRYNLEYCLEQKYLQHLKHDPLKQKPKQIKHHM